MRRDKDVDASDDARLSRDEAVAFEVEDHLMDRRSSDAEMPLHVGFGGGLAEDVLKDAMKVGSGYAARALFGRLAERPPEAAPRLKKREGRLRLR